MPKIRQFEIDTKNGWKFCNGCKKIHTLDRFTIHKQRNTYRHQCKDCRRNETNNYRQTHKESVRKNESKYRKEQRISNPEFRERVKQEKHKHYLKCKDKIIQRLNKYYKKRRDNDINFKIRGNLSHRIWLALQNRTTKSKRTMELLGCNIEFFRQYIESKFLPGMSWQNYGQGREKWQIDHIIPCRYFDLTIPENQIKCFNHSNLQPLWGYDNILKSDKLPDGIRARDIKNLNEE